MTFDTGFPALILDREVHPLLDIRKAMIVVGKAIAVNAKVIRDHK